jgi:GntR family transcriptional repressor for pyruvate dehydrogenase complex
MPEATGEVQRVVSELRRRILAGRYPAGLRLPPELELAADLGCSRPTLREGLKWLAGQGLLTSRRGSGVKVSDFRREGTLELLPAYLASGGASELPAAALASELLRLRAMMATEAARLAATYAPLESLGEARALAARLPGLASDPVEHTRVEVELFRALLVASGMWPVVWFANAFWEPVRGLHEQMAMLVWSVPADHPAMVRALFDAIERRQATRAEELVRAHFRAVDEQVGPRLDGAIQAGQGAS